jgi:5-methylcytosine-specific restriction protein B
MTVEYTAPLDRTWARLRAALEILAEASGPLTAGQVWPLVVQRFPLNDSEQEVTSGKQSRGRKYWQWQSLLVSRAGWLDKTRSEWRITDTGRAALAAYDDLVAMREEATRLYKEWEATRADGGRRAWLVRPDSGGAGLVQRWRDEGFVSLAGTHLGEVESGVDLAAVKAAVDSGYQHLDYAQRRALADAYHAFVSRMASDDIMLTVVDDAISVGVLTGELVTDPRADAARLRRATEWLDIAPQAVDELPAPLPALLDQQGTVVDLTAALEVLAEILGQVAAPDEYPEPPPHLPAATVVPRLPAATPELSAKLHMDEAWLQELIDTLQERHQIVLYGPPGTGKTFVAQAIARHIADRDAVRLVQFHSSYTYEDFFEGFRPVANGGFELKGGPLRELSSAASLAPERPFVLIVDEMNRGNLPKIFGELYFLLEYRDASIRLQYSPTSAFSLPRNLFVIGTMNTADRSIAALDAAIRRRFAFVELHPDETPVRDVLANWLTANHKQDDERAGLLAALNEAIGEEDRDFKIGPSYLMKPHVEISGGVERVWRHDLLPLLEDHYYGRLTRDQVWARFGLAALRQRMAASEPSPAGEPEIL